MGLDMYLTRKFYVKNWEYMKPNELHHITITKGDKPSIIPTDKISYIETEEIYWRKANAIHKWFVDNVQDGKDDCGTYYVSKEQLRELYNLCLKVLESTKLISGVIVNGYRIDQSGYKPIVEMGKTMEKTKVAEKLLPTQKGFFFGGYDYDEYYYQDIEHTKNELNRILNEPNDEGDFYYHASW